MSLIVPPELILHILSQLDPDNDKETLSACALTCSALRIDAQKSLFSSVKLIANFQWDAFSMFIFIDKSKASQRFLHSITSSLHLAGFVKKLEVQLAVPVPKLPETISLDHCLDPYFDPVPRESTQLVKIFSHLMHLDTLSITSPKIVNWHLFSPTLKRAFLRVFRSNPLRSVCTTGLEDIRIGSLYNSPRLQELTLRDLSFDEALPTQLKHSKPCSIRLRSLTIDAEMTGRTVMNRLLKFTKNPACPMTLAWLTRLNIISDDISAVPKILSCCAQTLTHLALVVPRKAKYSCTSNPSALEVAAACPLLDLGSLRKLTKLSISKCRVHSTLRPSALNGGLAGPAKMDRVEQTSTSFPWVNNVISSLSPNSLGPHLEIDIGLFIIDVSAQNLRTVVPWGTIMDPLLRLYRDQHVKHRLHAGYGTHSSKDPSLQCLRLDYPNTRRGMEGVLLEHTRIMQSVCTVATWSTSTT